jgi:hypothetical protein
LLRAETDGKEISRSRMSIVFGMSASPEGRRE